MDTATWDTSNPDDIICVVGARGKSQAIHGRSIAETTGRVPKVLISEFGFTQAEADEFTKMAVDQVGKPTEIDELRKGAARLAAVNRQQSAQIVTLQGQVAAAEKERDAAIEEKKILSTSLEQATAKIAELSKPAAPPPPPPAQEEKSDASKDEKSSGS